MNDSELWILYASVTRLNDEENGEKFQKIAQYFQKAQRIKASETNWESYVDQCKDMIKLCLDLAEGNQRITLDFQLPICPRVILVPDYYYENVWFFVAQKQCSKCVPDQLAAQHLNSAKLVLKSVAAKIKVSNLGIKYFN